MTILKSISTEHIQLAVNLDMVLHQVKHVGELQAHIVLLPSTRLVSLVSKIHL